MKFSEKGLTLVEMLIAIGVLMIIGGVAFNLLSPSESKAKARDNKRMADVTNLDRALIEYRLDNGVYPGSVDVVYKSNEIPSGSTSLYSALSGWILADLSEYITVYFTDPVNDSTYHYEYTRDSQSYELNARLEILFEDSENDGGNDPLKYELGNNLNLITP